MRTAKTDMKFLSQLFEPGVRPNADIVALWGALLSSDLKKQVAKFSKDDRVLVVLAVRAVKLPADAAGAVEIEMKGAVEIEMKVS